LAPTCHVTNGRPSIDSPHLGLVSRNTPEYQCLWFQFYRVSNFYCMAIAADSSSPTVLPSAADWVAAGIAAASETSVTSAAVVASTAIATVAATDSIITAADTTAVNAAYAAVTAPLAAAAGNNDDNARTTSKQASVISSAAEISLCAYFEEADWPLNKALPRGADFSCGPLGDIVRQYCLEKSQVAHLLLNYKKGRYLNTQVSILLNQSNLDERIREGMAMSTPRFVSFIRSRTQDIIYWA
jgi:hypothetical protein